MYVAGTLGSVVIGMCSNMECTFVCTSTLREGGGGCIDEEKSKST